MDTKGTLPVAKAPEPRTVTVRGEGVWEGWEVTAKADFPASVLIGLTSEDQATFYTALDRIVIEHNLPNEQGTLADSMAEVQPREGARYMSGLIFEAIAALPKL
jgi:hypothetical protein